MKIKARIWGCAWVGLSVFAGVSAANAPSGGSTFTSTPIDGPIPANTAHIEKYWLAKSRFDVDGQTGSLYIQYTDGTRVIAWKAPDTKVAMPAAIPGRYQLVGVDEITLAKDARSMGWAEMSTTCCESHPLPVSLAIYRSGNSVLHIRQGQVLIYWMFRDAGGQVVAVWGPAHDPQVYDYQLIDVETGRVVAEVSGDEKTQSLGANAPQWAKQAQRVME